MSPKTITLTEFERAAAMAEQAYRKGYGDALDAAERAINEQEALEYGKVTGMYGQAAIRKLKEQVQR